MGKRLIWYYRWKFAFFTVGSIGVLFGIAGLIFIREPKRGRFDGGMGHGKRIKPGSTLL